jgi:hypothetical protein
MHLASVFSDWQCYLDQDRLNALIGIEAQNRATRFIFHPSYSVSGPELYKELATRYMDANNVLDILHFTGRGYCLNASIGFHEQQSALVLERTLNDLPSWTPDWRVPFRPIALTTGVGVTTMYEFSMSSLSASFTREGDKLHVRGIKMDKVKVCGYLYWDTVMNNAYQIFAAWYELAKDVSNGKDLDAIFASTLLLDCCVKPIDRADLLVSKEEVNDLFAHWRSKNISCTPSSPDESTSGLEESTRFGNLAEELCRYRRFFVTQQGRLGLGPTCTSPGLSVYLIHGLATPFLIEQDRSQHVLYGECFVSEPMCSNIEASDQESHLCLI